MYDYIDIHSHLNFSDYEKDFDQVIKRLKDTNTATITVGTDLVSSRKAVELAEQYENIYACIGLHPADNTGETFNEEEFEKLVTQKKVVAVGECGLDYKGFKIHDLRFKNEKEKQIELFKKQIELAIEYDKTLMLHLRSGENADAYDDALLILESYIVNHKSKLRGNCHFYAGNIEQAKKFIELGFTISFTGVVTFAKDYDEVIKFIPLDKMMSETDCPFVTPVPYRGGRNEPSYVQEVVKKIAEIRGEDFEFVKKTLSNNAVKYFGLK
jgi:TatD DNase family protein